MKVTLCRSGLQNKYNRVNGEHKGSFTKEFKSLSELANYIASSNGKVLIVNFKQLNKRQRDVLARKYNSIRAKRDCQPYLYI